MLPQVLVLTKMKRLSHIIDSTRPKSQRKAENDASDVVFLLRYLVDKKQKIDYAAYQAKHPERLYEATGIVARA